MPETPIDSVYVSYSWGAEEETRLVEKLEEVCKKRSIELQRDKNSVGYGKSIRAYMDELGAGRHVVVVLSDAYLKSRYCMYELREVARHGQFRERVLPIVVSGTRCQEHEDRIPYFKYWEEKLTKLDAGLKRIGRVRTRNLNDALDDYADFRDHLDEWLQVLADMNTLTADIHVGTDFEALLKRLVPAAAEQPTITRLKRNREPDSRFRSRITAEIRGVLAKCRPLSDALEAEARKMASPASKDVAEFLCACELVQALDDLLRPASIACLKGLDAHRPEFDDTWQAAKALLCWLSLLAVSDEQIEALERREASSSTRRSGSRLSARATDRSRPTFAPRRGKRTSAGGR